MTGTNNLQPNVNEQAQTEMESRIEELERNWRKIAKKEDKQLELIEKSYADCCQIYAQRTAGTDGQQVQTASNSMT
jgi:hypothetical protein